MVAASHCLPVLVVFVLHFPLLLLVAPSWGLIVVPCWLGRFCLFCCGPKLVGVAPVSERKRWPFCNCPCLWLVRTLHSVLLSCLGVCYDWCCVVPSTHFLHLSRCLDVCIEPFSVQLLRFCPHVWLVRALCVVFGSTVCAIVTAATVASRPRSPVWLRRLRRRSQASSLRLRQICAALACLGNRGTSRFLPLCAMSQKVWKIGRMPGLDLWRVQIWYFWSCSASELCGTCGSLVMVASLNL